MSSINRNDFFIQYAQIIKKSYEFMHDPKKYDPFKYGLVNFVNNEPTIVSSRMEWIICPPIIRSRDEKKALAMILTRNEEGNNRVERLYFIQCENPDTQWLFTLNKTAVKTFSYVNDYPTISDSEILLKTFQSLLSDGLFDNDHQVRDEFFEGFWAKGNSKQ
jgi:hypothetical protein